MMNQEALNIERFANTKTNADKGHAYSQFVMGISYSVGECEVFAEYGCSSRYEGYKGTEKNLIEAAKYYKLSADQGEKLAATKLSELYNEAQSQNDVEMQTLLATGELKAYIIENDLRTEKRTFIYNIFKEAADFIGQDVKLFTRPEKFEVATMFLAHVNGMKFTEFNERKIAALKDGELGKIINKFPPQYTAFLSEVKTVPEKSANINNNNNYSNNRDSFSL